MECTTGTIGNVVVSKWVTKSIFIAQLKGDLHSALVPLNENVFSNILKWLHNRLSEVRRQIVPNSRSSCTEGVAKVGARPTDEKRTSVSQAQSSWTV